MIQLSGSGTSLDTMKVRLWSSLLNNKRLLDENIHMLKGGKPWLISTVVHTVKATGIAPDMILVPGTEFSYDVSTGEDFIPYPDVSGISIKVDSFLIDKYPVTNAQYYEFLQSSGYRTSRYSQDI